MAIERPIDLELEAAYNAALQVPESLDILARWRAASAAWRHGPRAALDQPYGPGDRQRYDLFHAGAPAAPLVVFIHGGYWRKGDRQDYAFVARALNAVGLDVAVPSYSLCPAVSVRQIIDELRGCLAALWRTMQQRPVVLGHSAGGHLTAAMLATDWGNVSGVPADLVRAGCAISGVFELAPLIATTINADVRLDHDAAAAASPLFWQPPPPGRALVAAVGAHESSEFHRQSRTMAAAWASAGLHTEYLSIAGANHYTVVDELTRPDSELFGRVVALTRPAKPSGST
jgi:arylformamidase